MQKFHVSWKPALISDLCSNINPLAPEFFFNISTPVCKMWIIQVPKKGSIMKQTAFWREKSGECATCLKYSVRIFVD
jgi:hypothetical protein